MQIRVDSAGLGVLLQALERAPRILEEEQLRAVMRAGLLLEGELGQALPQGAGAQSGSGLAGSLFSEQESYAGNVIGVTASQQPYALYVEIGRQPGKMPPHEPVADWVRAKLGVPEDQVDSVVYLIRRKIATKGTPPNPVWERTLQANELQIMAFIGEGIERALERIAA